MPLPVSNADLVRAHAHAESLRAYGMELRRRIDEDSNRLAVVKAALRVSLVHRGIALECLDGEDGDATIRAAGADVWAAGRRASVFRDGAGWATRLHYRPSARKGGLPRDPGAFEFPDRRSAVLCAMDWAACGEIRRPPSPGPAAQDAAALLPSF